MTSRLRVNTIQSSAGLSTITVGASSVSFGDIEASKLTASTGILFGTDTAAANTLDDYEEGTWTPTYLGSSGNPTITYNIQDGVYTKIGNTVHCQGRLQTSAASGGSGAVQIGNFPFVSKATNDRGVVNIGYSNDWLTQAPETGHTINGDNYATLRYFSGNGTPAVTTSNLRNVAANDNDIMFDVTYEVA